MSQDHGNAAAGGNVSAPPRLAITRRRVLIALVGLAPAARFLGATSAWAAAGDDAFLRTSRIITGTDSLSADIARRIQSLLADRVTRFAPRLAELADALTSAGGDRQQMLGALTDEQVGLALDIAKPWYLGYVGTPSSFVLKDDAAFATFLEAQAWEKIVDEVPRPTYPTQGAGWWDVAPPGVDAPAMPDGITDWNFHPGGPSRILAPDPRWKAYASAKHAGVEAARRAKPDENDTSG